MGITAGATSIAQPGIYSTTQGSFSLHTAMQFLPSPTHSASAPKQGQGPGDCSLS